MATDWPPFLLQKYAVTRTRPGGVKNYGQYVANHFYFLLECLEYIGHCFDGVQNDWPQIGHHFCLKNGGVLGLALLEAKMMANLWPIILNSIKAKSYTLMILELNLNMIGHRLAIFFASSSASPSKGIFLRQK